MAVRTRTVLGLIAALAGLAVPRSGFSQVASGAPEPSRTPGCNPPGAHPSNPGENSPHDGGSNPGDVNDGSEFCRMGGGLGPDTGPGVTDSGLYPDVVPQVLPEEPPSSEPGPPIICSFSNPSPGCGSFGEPGSSLQRPLTDTWLTAPDPGTQGWGWFQNSRPVLMFDNIVLGENGISYSGVTRARIKFGALKVVDFKRIPNTSTYVGVNGAQGILVATGGGDDDSGGDSLVLLYKYFDTDGRIWTFFGHSVDNPLYPNTASGSYGAGGQLWKVESSDGVSGSYMQYVGHPTSPLAALASGFDHDEVDDHPTKRAISVYSNCGQRRDYSYTLLDTQDNQQTPSRIASITVWTDTDPTSGTNWVQTQTHEYSYYDSNESYGDEHDLKMITIRTPLSNGVESVQKTYYRYWGSSGTHLPMYEVSAEGMRRIEAAALNAETMSNTDLAPYASRYWEYNCKGQVKIMKSGAFCGCSNSREGVYKMFREVNALFNPSGTLAYRSQADIATGDWGADRWATRTYILFPDYTMTCTYYDEMGWPLAKVVSDCASTSDPLNSSSNPFDPATNTLWITKYERDGYGRLIREYTVDAIARDSSNSNVMQYVHGPYRPTMATCTESAVNLTTDSPRTAGTITVNASAGLVKHTVYRTPASSSNNYLMHAVAAKKISQGKNNTPITLEEWEYENADSGVASLTIGGARISKMLPTAHRVYRNASTPDTTTMSYTYYGDANSTYYGSGWQPKVVTGQLPSLESGDTSGPSTVNLTTCFDRIGRTVLEKDGGGTWTFTKYYTDTGTVAKVVLDPNDTDANTAASGFGVSIGSGLNYATQFAYDLQGRVTLTTLPSNRASPNYYTQLADGRLVRLSIPLQVGSTLYGPVDYEVTNFARKTEAIGTIALPGGKPTSGLSDWISSSSTDVIGAVSSSIGSVAHLTTHTYDQRGTRLDSTRVFHSIPGSYSSASSTQYDATNFGYDLTGRLRRVKDPTGTITYRMFDALGRITERYIGTNDKDWAGGEPSGTNNMTLAESIEYDDNGVGNGLLTKRTLHPDISNSANNRVTELVYDWRRRLIVQKNLLPPHRVFGYDNANHVTAVASYTSSTNLSSGTLPTDATTTRSDLIERFFNTRGQMRQTTRHKIAQSGGSAGSSLDSISSKQWFDGAGRVVKSAGSELTKTVYDSLGREVREFVLASDGGDSTYSDATGLTGDLVLEEHRSFYDDAAKTGNLLMNASIARHPKDSTTTGALYTGSSLGAIDPSYTIGRPQITAYYYDDQDRLTNIGQVGTNGGAAFTRSSYTTAGSLPSGTLTSTTSYNADGTVYQEIDPKGILSSNFYDAAMRRIKTIQNYVNGTPGPNDQDQVIEYGYTNGLMTTLTAKMPSSTDDQVTTYTYGVTRTTSGATGTSPASTVASNRLLWKVQYPDSSGGTDVVQYGYNALGQVTGQIDQNNVQISKSYDTLGRELSRAATVPSGSAIDTSVLRIQMAYLNRGTIDTVTQYNAASGGSITDQVQFSYDDWGNLGEFRQDVDSAISATSTGRASFAAAYNYTKSASTSGRALIRRTQALYKGASSTFRQVNFEYGSTNSLNDHASRVASVTVGSSSPATVASYDYLGSDDLVGTMLDQADVNTRLYAYSGGTHTYPDMDQFDRPTRWDWQRLESTGGAAIYDYNMAYDANSNPTSTIDNLAVRQVGTNAGKHLFDTIYGLDNLNRVISADEGNKSGSAITNRTRKELWNNLSLTGNWGNRQLDANGDGDVTDVGDADEAASGNTFNKANEWTHRRAYKMSANDYDDFTYSYDAAGNMVGETKEIHRTSSSVATATRNFVYDAFGRLVKVTNPSLSESEDRIAQYRYNGLGFRIMVQYDDDADGTFEDNERVYFAYDERWRMIASFRNADSYPKEAFVYHTAGKAGRGGSSYIDSVILRDRNTTTPWTSSAGTSLNERRYYLQNWRADVVAILNDSGDPLEHIRYSAYGEPTVYPVADVNRDGKVDTADSADYDDLYGEGDSNNCAVSVDLNCNGSTGDDYELFNYSYSLNSGKSGKGHVSSDEVGNRKGYAGYEWDPVVGVCHVRNRVYMPEIGRWMRRDPLGGPIGANIYQYVASKAMYFLDPFGLFGLASWSHHSLGDLFEPDEPWDPYNPYHKRKPGEQPLLLPEEDPFDFPDKNSPDEPPTNIPNWYPFVPMILPLPDDWEPPHIDIFDGVTVDKFLDKQLINWEEYYMTPEGRYVHADGWYLKWKKLTPSIDFDGDDFEFDDIHFDINLKWKIKFGNEYFDSEGFVKFNPCDISDVKDFGFNLTIRW